MLYGGHVKVLEDIGFLKGLGFDFGELVLWNAKSRKLWKSSGLKNDLSDGFFLLAHGPNEGPPNDLDNLWNKCYPALCKTIDVAGQLRIKLLVIHLWMDRRFVKPAVREEKKRVLRELCDYGMARKVLICLENLSEDAEDLAAALTAVSGLGLTLDVGHGQLLAETNTSFRIIDELLPFIKHVHLHDNKGGLGVADDLHLAIGDGVVDFAGILGALVAKGFDGTMTLEVKKEVLWNSCEIVKDLVGQTSNLRKCKSTCSAQL
ncbi:MAG: sugar phosphate isomerase/epimerase [Desulfomonile tiedjei]|nr:sugar phosphate isomerase/epimerase [Desulfomonile tiedjei]